MKNFWRDYFDLLKHNNSFYKKHWFGIIIYELVCFGLGFGGFYLYGKKLQKEEMNKQIENLSDEEES